MRCVICITRPWLRAETPMHPSDLLRDLIQGRGSTHQLSSYIALIAGLRRSLDDWIPPDRLDSWTRIAARLGLTVIPDCLFCDLAGAPYTGVVPTTRATAEPWRSGASSGSRGMVHVFVSSSRERAEEALAAGWYSLVVHGRPITKPLVDHGRLGMAFGYPECCVKFFMSRNDWPRWNTLAESFKASRQTLWECNCLTKHTPCMMIYHMPCSFDCSATTAYSRSLF